MLLRRLTSPHLRTRALALAGGRLRPQLLVLHLALQLLECSPQMPAELGGREELGDPSRNARARDAIREAQLNARATVRQLAEAPAAALVHAHHRAPCHVPFFLPLDDLDQTANLGGADADQHPIAGAEPTPLVARDLPARDTGHEVKVVRGIGEVVTDQPGRRGDDDRLVQPHGDPQPITGSRRSAASVSSVSCMTRVTYS